MTHADVSLQRRRLSDRTLWLLVGLGVLALAVALGLAWWLNSTVPLQPVPVSSSPSA